jgi:uncharacterized protein (TIGR02246 family)
MRKTLAMAACVLALAACSGADKHHKAEAKGALPSEGEIAALFDKWNETLQDGSAHDMAMLYAEDGVLLPTVSNQARNNRGEITDYFEHFLEKKPRGTINEQYIDVLDENTAVNSGIYTFDLTKDGEATFVVARYSYLYEKVAGKWLIKSHHSSAMPEPVESRPVSLADKRTARVSLTAMATGKGQGEDAHGAKPSAHGDDDHGAAHDDHTPAKKGADHGHGSH